MRARSKRLWRKKKRTSAPATVAKPPDPGEQAPADAAASGAPDVQEASEGADPSQPIQESDAEGSGDDSTVDGSEVEEEEWKFIRKPESPSKGMEIYSDTSDTDDSVRCMSGKETPRAPLDKDKDANDPSREIEFSELLRYIAKFSPFSLGDPPSSRPPSDLRLSCQPLTQTKEHTFVALSMSEAIVGLAERRLAEAQTSPQANQVGVVPSFPMKGSLRPYQISSSDLLMTPAAQCEDRPYWMPAVARGHRSYVKEGDLIQLEQYAREALLIQSSMEAQLAAVSNTLASTPGWNALHTPFVVRTLAAMASALAELVKRNFATLQQVTLHRRDMALWNAPILPSQVGRLRHAPFIGERALFERNTLQAVVDEFAEGQKQKAFTQVARSAFQSPQRLQSPPPSKKSGLKRSLSAQESAFSTPVPKKAKASKLESTPKSSTTKGAAAKKHR